MCSKPASRSFLAVPPVESSSTFLEARKVANSTMPALSETEMRARVMGTTSASEPDGIENALIGIVSYESYWAYVRVV